MYMNVKLFAENEKSVGNQIKGCRNIQLRHLDGIWHRKMCRANNKKRKTTNDGRNGTTKPRKYMNGLKKRKTYKYLGRLKAATRKQVEMSEKLKKNKKKKTHENEKCTRNQFK